MTELNETTAEVCRASVNAIVRKGCEQIDLMPQFKGLRSSATRETRALLKINLFENIYVTHGIALPASICGDTDRREVLRTIRHMGTKVRGAIADAFEALDSRHRCSGPPRHDPEREIDRALDAYDFVLVERGYGPPRSKYPGAGVSVVGAAAEMRFPLADLDKLARARLEYMAANHPVGPIHTSASKMKARKSLPRVLNPAVPTLVDKAIKAHSGGFPEDPLQPGKTDVVTFAWSAGVSTSDILQSPLLVARIEQEAVKKPLIPNPLLEARRYSYAELICWARDEERLDDLPADENGKSMQPASRKQVHALRQFIAKYAGHEGEAGLVPYDFKERLEQAIAGRYDDFGPGWRGLVDGWVKWNDLYRSTKPVAETLAVTLRILCREVGLTIWKLGGANGGTIYNWMTGFAIPTHGSETTLKAVAERLRVPVSVLKRTMDPTRRKRLLGHDSDLFPCSVPHLPEDFETKARAEQLEILENIHWRNVRQGLAYGRRQAFMTADPYLLTKDEWTLEMQAAWSANLPEAAQKRSPLRAFGAAPRPRNERGKTERPEKPWRPGTVLLKEKSLSCLLGYLRRPREINDLTPVVLRASKIKSAREEAGASELADDQVPEFVREGGLGIPTELLKPGVLALTDLMLAFNYWKTRRSGRYTRSILLTLHTISRMLRPKTGIVWKSPEMIDHLEAFASWWQDNPHETVDTVLTFDIQPFRDDWYSAVENAFKIVLDDIDLARDADLKPSRDSFLSVGIFVDDDKPMEKYMVGVRTLLAARPHSISSRHVHTRDCIQALILVQTGLRTHNMMLTYDDGSGLPNARRRDANGNFLPPTLRKVVKQDTVEWIIEIPSSDFKNWYSPYFSGERPYKKVLADEDRLYDLLDEYVTKARPYMLKGRKSDAFFVGWLGGDLDESSLGSAYHRITGRYFVANPESHGGVEGAMVHAMHAVRNVIATHIVRETGDIYLAAWAIQDTPRTVEKHYARFIPADKVKHVDKVLAAARQIGRKSEQADGRDVAMAA